MLDPVNVQRIVVGGATVLGGAAAYGLLEATEDKESFGTTKLWTTMGGPAAIAFGAAGMMTDTPGLYAAAGASVGAFAASMIHGLLNSD